MWLLCELRPLFRAQTHVSKGSWHVCCSHVLHGPLSLNLSLRELAFPPKPASLLPCLTPARNWGASLPWSSTPPESSLPSCPFKFLNHLRLCLLSTLRTVPPGSSGPRDDFSSAPQACTCRCFLGVGVAERPARGVGSFCLSSCGLKGGCCLVCWPQGWQHTLPPLTDLLCLGTHGLRFYTDRLTRPLGSGGGALGCVTTPGLVPESSLLLPLPSSLLCQMASFCVLPGLVAGSHPFPFPHAPRWRKQNVMIKSMTLESDAWVQILAPPSISCVTLGKLLKLSVL